MTTMTTMMRTDGIDDGVKGLLVWSFLWVDETRFQLVAPVGIRVKQIERLYGTMETMARSDDVYMGT